MTNHPTTLPLLPDPTHHLWRRRCYNCLELGHDQNECTRQERTCAKCWQTGHEARACNFTTITKPPPFDPLVPHGNFGDSLMPPRPRIAMVFIPETNQMQQDACEMLRAIVIDARLREHHNLHILQSMLMATCATPYPFPITQMNDKQYLLVLPRGIDREAFLNAHSTHLCETGYVTFPWSASVNGTPVLMQFKVWVDLKGMAPRSWTVEHLISAAGSFGCVLEHVTMSNRASIERMRAVVAVPDLALVPENVGVWVRGILREVQINVHAWIEEPIPTSAPPDTPPPMTFFEQARCNFSPNLASRADHVEGLDNLMVDFDTLFAIWAAMDSGTEKVKIEKILRNSPRFTASLQAPPLGQTDNTNAADLCNKEKMVELEGQVHISNGGETSEVRSHVSFNAGTAIVPHTESENDQQIDSAGT